MMYTLKVDAESADELVKIVLKDTLNFLEAESPEHPADIAWQAEMVEAIAVVLKYL